jgi:hypothetical protein
MRDEIDRDASRPLVHAQDILRRKGRVEFTAERGHDRIEAKLAGVAQREASISGHG